MAMEDKFNAAVRVIQSLPKDGKAFSHVLFKYCVFEFILTN